MNKLNVNNMLFVNIVGIIFSSSMYNGMVNISSHYDVGVGIAYIAWIVFIIALLFKWIRNKCIDNDYTKSIEVCNWIIITCTVISILICINVIYDILNYVTNHISQQMQLYMLKYSGINATIEFHKPR